MYAILDQTLWRSSAPRDRTRALRGFLEYGRTEQSLSSIYEHLGGGITWTGFPYRPHDMAGFSPQYARLSPEAGFPHGYELALEGFYNLRLTHQLSLQPDLQYIIDPGGTYPDALVGTIRLKVNL
jgi:porin